MIKVHQNELPLDLPELYIAFSANLILLTMGIQKAPSVTSHLLCTASEVKRLACTYFEATPSEFLAYYAKPRC